jgi:D-alanyl-D-alanine dipeptidase
VITSDGIDLKKDTGYNAGRDRGKVITEDKTVIEYGGVFLKGAVVTVTKGMIYGEDGVVELQPSYYLVPKKLKDNLVDVAQYTDDIAIDMLFAKDGNILGDKIYDYEVCLLQKGTLEKLEKAAEIFKKDGYTIVIYDAYRPYSVTVELYKKYRNGEYVAPIRFGSVHNKGAAVDMSLLDSNGMSIEMPSPIHTFNSSSNRNNKSMTRTAKANMNYMTKVMKKCGFDTIESEWWHFTDTKSKEYLRTDYDLNSLLRIIYE